MILKELASQSSDKQTVNAMVLDALFDYVCAQVLYQLHFNKIANAMALQLENAPEDVHQSLLAI